MAVACEGGLSRWPGVCGCDGEGRESEVSARRSLVLGLDGRQRLVWSFDGGVCHMRALLGDEDCHKRSETMYFAVLTGWPNGFLISSHSEDVTFCDHIRADAGSARDVQ